MSYPDRTLERGGWPYAVLLAGTSGQTQQQGARSQPTRICDG